MKKLKIQIERIPDLLIDKDFEKEVKSIYKDMGFDYALAFCGLALLSNDKGEIILDGAHGEEEVMKEVSKVVNANIQYVISFTEAILGVRAEDEVPG